MKNIEYISTPDFENARERGWNGPGWYFWDEADGQYCYGPFNSSILAEQELEKYGKSL